MTPRCPEPLLGWIEQRWAEFERTNPEQTILDRPLRRPITENAVARTQMEDQYGKGEQGALF